MMKLLWPLRPFDLGVVAGAFGAISVANYLDGKPVFPCMIEALIGLIFLAVHTIREIRRAS